MSRRVGEMGECGVHGTEARECGANCNTRETHLGNGRINHPLLTKLIEQAFRDLGIQSPMSIVRVFVLLARGHTLYAPL